MSRFRAGKRNHFAKADKTPMCGQIERPRMTFEEAKVTCKRCKQLIALVSKTVV